MISTTVSRAVGCNSNRFKELFRVLDPIPQIGTLHLPDDLSPGRDFDQTGGAGNQDVAIRQSVGIADVIDVTRPPKSLLEADALTRRIGFNKQTSDTRMGN